MAAPRLLTVTSESGTRPPAPDGVGGGRSFELVPDYPFAAPGGARWLTLFEVAPGIDILAPASGGWEATVYEQVSPGEGWLSPHGPASGRLPTGTAVLHVVMDVDPDALELFHAWYDEEHLPAMVGVPGIPAARRFRAVAGSGVEAAGRRRRFLALYELRDGDVFHGPEWDKVSTVTPRTSEVMPHVDWASQLYRLLS